jgi:hypothetical protein
VNVLLYHARAVGLGPGSIGVAKEALPDGTSHIVHIASLTAWDVADSCSVLCKAKRIWAVGIGVPVAPWVLPAGYNLKARRQFCSNGYRCYVDLWERF